VEDHVLLISMIAIIVGIINAVLIGILWHILREQKNLLWQFHSATQRQTREITQQRYAIATVRKMVVDSGETAGLIENIEEMEEAVDILDDVAPENLLTEKELDKVLEQQTDIETQIEKGDVDKLKDKEILEYIKSSVRNNHIALAQQPIVILPERRLAYYEIFARISTAKQGYLPAHKFINVAKSNNLIGAIDSLLMMRCLHLLKNRTEKDDQSEFFINVSVQTFMNKEYLYRLVEFLTVNPKLSSRLVFELTQEDWLKISAAVKSVLDGLSLLGCRFSMDKVEVLGIDTSRLSKQNITFIKIDASTLEKEILNSGGSGRIKRIKNMLDAQRVSIIVEKVENEKQLAMLQELRADFGQGYLFGAPVIVE